MYTVSKAEKNGLKLRVFRVRFVIGCSGVYQTWPEPVICMDLTAYTVYVKQADVLFKVKGGREVAQIISVSFTLHIPVSQTRVNITQIDQFSLFFLHGDMWTISIHCWFRYRQFSSHHRFKAARGLCQLAHVISCNVFTRIKYIAHYVLGVSSAELSEECVTETRL